MTEKEPPHCMSCMWWRGRENDTGRHECRGAPPSTTITHDFMQTVWPQTAPFDYCSLHKPVGGK